jgi:hypothetical protein
MLIEPLFTELRCRISLGTIDRFMNKEDVVYIHNEVLFSYKEEGNPVICSKMDEMENIGFSEMIQTQIDKHHIFCLINRN